jgi:hypothetical protein
MADRLPRPDAIEPSLWIDEAIWGHRFYDEQVPWLVFLELLNVLASENAEGRPFQEKVPNQLHYVAARRLHLRNLVFNNPLLELVRLQVQKTEDEERWIRWLAEMGKHASGLGEDPVNFAYLKQRFASFDEFSRVVHLVRSTAIEGDSNKRWTSKFVFPYGPSCLYEDLRIDDSGNASNDRRFFARTGEMAYLMLCRSGRGEELAKELQSLLLNPHNKWDRLVAQLQPPQGESGKFPTSRASAYLPYHSLPDYDALAEDLLALLKTRLPGYDVLPHLVNILGLHLILYMLRRAAEIVQPPHGVRLVLEMIAPKRTTVRDLALESYQNNNHLSAQAIDRYIESELVSSSEWQAVLGSDDPFLDATKVIEQKVQWIEARHAGEKYKGLRTPEELLKTLKEKARERHGQHVANTHARYASAIGLASKRGTRRIRYAPNDQLLRSIVLATVKHRMEFQGFLRLLWERYGFLIGDQQATGFIGTGGSDRRAFQENAQRLEARLESLGMLRRLSDACAYVENPLGVDR